MVEENSPGRTPDGLATRRAERPHKTFSTTPQITQRAPESTAPTKRMHVIRIQGEEGGLATHTPIAVECHPEHDGDGYETILERCRTDGRASDARRASNRVEGRRWLPVEQVCTSAPEASRSMYLGHPRRPTIVLDVLLTSRTHRVDEDGSNRVLWELTAESRAIGQIEVTR